MTFGEFRALHPKIVQYDRAGVSGIDFAALHERIEGSRYLKGKHSFLYLAKNYGRILAGEFEDFPESEKARKEREEREVVDKSRQRERELRGMITKLRALDLTLIERAELIEETGVTPEDAIEELAIALMSEENKSSESAGRQFYARITGYINGMAEKRAGHVHIAGESKIGASNRE